MLKKMTLACLATCIMGIGLAQSYSANREKFVKEFQKSLSDYGKGDFSDFAKDVLPKALLESSDFPDAYFTKMVETANLMESKRLKPYPEIYNYVFSVYSFVRTKQPRSSYDAWHNSVDNMLDSRNVRKFEDFIEFSAGFFSERKLSESSNFEWFFEGGTYEFKYDDKPYVICSDGNLVCRVENNDRNEAKEKPYLDSINVYHTSGVFDPILKKWEGKGGRVTWEKVELDKNKFYADLKSYDASLKSSNLNVDTVMLTSAYFSKPTAGKLSERAFRINREEDKIYPQFLSFEKRLRISEIRPNVDYDGGFSLRGDNFVGLGTPEEPAKVIVKRAGKTFAQVSSQQFIINPKTLGTHRGAVTLYLNNNQDSIYHPGADFKYDTENKIMECARTSLGIGQAPFQNSYHMVDMYIPKLTWAFDSQEILLTYDVGVSQEQRIARMESRNFFDARLYEQLQGMQGTHPLVALSQYAYKYDEYVMDEGKAASALGKTIEQAKSQLLELSNLGFISYDTETKTVTINPKLNNFVQARAGKKDYDNIIFVSDMRPKELTGYSDEQIQADPNLQALAAQYRKQNEERRLKKNFGVLSLSSLTIDLDAVDLVQISDLQNAVVFPSNSKVIVKKNRDFEFNGWLNAGKSQINILSGNYNYADNKVNLLKTGETYFRVLPLSERDGKRPITMQSAVWGITGELLVDDPGNRSGLKEKGKQFPQLISKKPAYIYYNSPNIYRGAYDSTRFYYTVDPFTRDSLMTFNEKTMELKGELTSAGIFPKFREPVKIMPDYSFGFSTQAPAGGYDFYGPKAKYDNKIVLSNNGLQGAGTINFVKSSSLSKAFTFLPDSTIGYAQFTNTAVENGVQFPDVTGEDVFVTYVPKSNYLKAAATPKNDLSFFKGEARLRGTAIVRPEGMNGSGLMTFNTATTVSDNYTFKRWDINADTSSFSLKNNYQEEGEDPLAFNTDNVNTHISFKDRKGEFKSNRGETTVAFPVNQYVCKMDQFTWFMDRESIEMQSNGEKDIAINSDLDLSGPNFFSVNPKQDSLQFRAPKAKFSLKEKTIYCSEVEYLDIADARIYPDSMKINIRKKAKMDPLTNAKIVANYITKYHTFRQANVEITARRAYSGSAKYPYYDMDSTMTLINIDKIGLDSSYQTVAYGQVSPEDEFRLSPQFDYYGKVNIRAASQGIYFDGATRINHDCDKFERNWLAFSAAIDPKNIQIPVSTEMKNLEGKPITAGIVWHDSRVTDSIYLYPTFLSALEGPDDIIAISSSGYLQYSFDAKEFQIGSREKLLNRSEKGNFLALHTESCSMNGSGVINLGMDFGEAPVDAVGNVSYNQSTGRTEMNITARFHIPIDKGIMEDAAARIVAIEGLKPLDFNGTSLEQAILEWTDQKTADKLKSDYTIKGEIKKLPSELETAFIVTGLKLYSFSSGNFQERGLITETDNAYLLNFFETPILKQVPVKAFFQQTYSGAMSDKYGIWFNLPAGLDYYFDYQMVKKDGQLRILSGDAEFNNAIAGLKDDKRKSKNFVYEIVTNRVYLTKFLRYFGVE